MLNENVETDSIQSDLTGIITAAIKREREVALKYKQLAVTSQNSKISSLLIVMAEEELKHKKSLELELEFYSKSK